MIWFFALLYAILFCILSGKVVEDKGYEEDTIVVYRILGFLLGIFGLILAAAKPDLKKEKQEREDKQKMEYIYNSMVNSNRDAHNNYSQSSDKEIFEWKCESCGLINKVNKTKCFKCGNERTVPINYKNKNVQERTDTNTDISSELRKFKQLFDEGAITDEEYNKVKNDLLKRI